MAWKAYSIIPIDLRWEMLPTVEDAAALLARTAANEVIAGHGTGSSVEQFLQDFRVAKGMAEREGWEGDFRGEPRVFWIPDELEFAYGFVWKQDNNGTTYVVSPQPLPWLDAL